MPCEAWLLYDFFSIPQLELGSPCLEDIDRGDAVGVQDHRQIDQGTVVSDMMAAVSSIPVYVNLSHYFIIVAPPAYHPNTKEFAILLLGPDAAGAESRSGATCCERIARSP